MNAGERKQKEEGVSCPAAKSPHKELALVCPLLGPSHDVVSVRPGHRRNRPAGGLTKPQKPLLCSGLQMKGPEKTEMLACEPENYDGGNDAKTASH